MLGPLFHIFIGWQAECSGDSTCEAVPVPVYLDGAALERRKPCQCMSLAVILLPKLCLKCVNVTVAQFGPIADSSRQVWALDIEVGEGWLDRGLGGGV